MKEYYFNENRDTLMKEYYFNENVYCFSIQTDTVKWKAHTLKKAVIL
jgi:hypothetical protein